MNQITLINRAIIIFCLTMMSLLTGCWVYGSGEAIGYVNVVDDGILWDKVWLKTSLESSAEDCYLIKDGFLEMQLRDLIGEKMVKIHYYKHFWSWSICTDGSFSNDEIISFEVIEVKALNELK